MDLRKLLTALVLIFTVENPLSAQTDKHLLDLLSGSDNSWFREKIDRAEDYRIQIIYTKIDRDKNNNPSFKHYRFRLNADEYFNPASTVKLPVALLSLEKTNRMQATGVNAFSPMLTDSAYSGQTIAHTDKTAESGLPSIAHYIRKAFLVSDNDAYNRMYEFVGQGAINTWLQEKGFRDTRITHRFVALSEQENRCTNPIRFLGPDGTVIHSQPAQCNEDEFDFTKAEKLGDAHYSRGELIQEPMDFSRKNRLPLWDLHRMLIAVMFPASVPEAQRFLLTEDDYNFLYQYMSQFPGETNYPKYDTTQYFDSYVKFFFRDSAHHHLPEGVRVFNKVGWSYGFMIDGSYVADFRNGVEFFLSAVIYANADGILNDNRYEYASVSHPFLYELGQLIYRHELGRKRKYQPDLDRFRLRYEQRRDDSRPLVRDVEN